MAKKTEAEKPASWCPYCRNFVVSCTHSGGRAPVRKPKTDGKGK